MQQNRSNKADRNITRMEHAKVTGYWVRVVKDGTLYQKLFSDNQYGGKEQALFLARAYRDELRQRLYGTAAACVRQVRTSFKSNRSGVIGVHYAERKRGNSVSRSFVASWCPLSGGPQKHKSFSVAKYGEEEAFRLACEFRKAREQEILTRKRKMS